MGNRITNEQIYKKIVEIEKIIKKVAKEEKILGEKEIQLEKIENKELRLLKKLHGKNIKKYFKSVPEWKRKIWDNCPDKKVINLRNKKEVDFLCKKTGRSCRFIDCYRNKVE